MSPSKQMACLFHLCHPLLATESPPFLDHLPNALTFHCQVHSYFGVSQFYHWFHSSTACIHNPFLIPSASCSNPESQGPEFLSVIAHIILILCSFLWSKLKTLEKSPWNPGRQPPLFRPTCLCSSSWALLASGSSGSFLNPTISNCGGKNKKT